MTKSVKLNIFICLFTHFTYSFQLCYSSCFNCELFGDLGGMFCSLPLHLAPCLGVKVLPLWCSRFVMPGPPNFPWIFVPLRECNGWRWGRLSLNLCGLSVLYLDLGRGSSTLFTLTSCRGWTGDVAGGEGEDVFAGGGSLASLWHTSA